MPNTITYAYIDAQNLHQSSKHWGWKLDYLKLRNYLRSEYNVSVAYLFMGYIQENQEIYSNLQKHGYVLIFKETSEIEEYIKGNCDVEMVMQAMIDINEYDDAVIISGDGDFVSLIRHLISKDKLKELIIPNKNSFSKLLSKATKDKMQYLNIMKQKLFAPMFKGDDGETKLISNQNSQNYNTKKSISSTSNHQPNHPINHQANINLQTSKPSKNPRTIRTQREKEESTDIETITIETSTKPLVNKPKFKTNPSQERPVITPKDDIIGKDQPSPIAQRRTFKRTVQAKRKEIIDTTIPENKQFNPKIDQTEIPIISIE
jgi:uncharacterized LabA/DUF88 family protein